MRRMHIIVANAIKRFIVTEHASRSICGYTVKYAHQRELRINIDDICLKSEVY